MSFKNSKIFEFTIGNFSWHSGKGNYKLLDSKLKGKVLSDYEERNVQNLAESSQNPQKGRGGWKTYW